MMATCDGSPPLALTALACNPDAPAESSFGAGPTSMPEPASSSSSSSSSGSSGSTSSGGSTSDASSSTAASETGTGAPPPDFGPPGPAGCLGKIDFLFVIANANTMAPHQKQLLTIFPAFYNALAGEFADFRRPHHVCRDGRWMVHGRLFAVR
jgi:hypothetical protein